MSYTDFLVASPSFLSGFARTLDIGATLREHSYAFSPTPEEADLRAVASDWRMVGTDLRVAVRQFDKELAVSKLPVSK